MTRDFDFVKGLVLSEHISFSSQLTAIAMNQLAVIVRLKPRLAVSLVIFYLSLASEVAAGTNAPQLLPREVYTPTKVTIQKQTIDGVISYATRYIASLGNCSIIWIAYDTELDRGVVKNQTDCTVSLAEQMPTLNRICSKFLNKDRNATVFRTLFWGTLFPERAEGAWEMSYRLALAAFRSPEWDKAKGKLEQGDLNRFTKELANQAEIYPELTEMFATFNRTVTLGHVEKVRVLNAGQLSFFPQLERQVVKATDRLPFDCMSWFAISKK